MPDQITDTGHGEMTLVERAFTLPRRPLRDDRETLDALAAIAAIAEEYAAKVEAGTATDIDITTLRCNCDTLARDLFTLAKELPDA